MDLDWLKDFLSLAQEKNFSRAAEARHVTQPAFSRRIRALEDWIGAPLFERGQHGASLTPAGLHLLPLAEELARGVERARRETRAIGRRETRALSIAATHALSFTFFPGWIRRLGALAGLGALTLTSDSMEACEEIMLAGEVDFLLCHWRPDAPTRLDGARFPAVTVGSDALLPVAAPAAMSEPARPARRLAYSRASGLGRILAACSAPAADEGADAVFVSDQAAALLSMAREGQGVAWLPRTMIEDDLALGRLVAAGPVDAAIAVEIRLFRAAQPRSAAAEELWRAVNG